MGTVIGAISPLQMEVVHSIYRQNPGTHLVMVLFFWEIQPPCILTFDEIASRRLCNSRMSCFFLRQKAGQNRPARRGFVFERLFAMEVVATTSITYIKTNDKLPFR